METAPWYRINERVIFRDISKACVAINHEIE